MQKKFLQKSKLSEKQFQIVPMEFFLLSFRTLLISSWCQWSTSLSRFTHVWRYSSCTRSKWCQWSSSRRRFTRYRSHRSSYISHITLLRPDLNGAKGALHVHVSHVTEYDHHRPDPNVASGAFLVNCSPSDKLCIDEKGFHRLICLRKYFSYDFSGPWTEVWGFTRPKRVNQLTQFPHCKTGVLNGEYKCINSCYRSIGG